jgi:peptide/nickel transport system permease protein
VLSYILKRLLWIPPTLVGITLLVFIGIRLAPGDPAALMVGLGAGLEPGTDVSAQVQELRQREGLDRSLWVQYLGFVGPLNVKPDGHPWFGGSGHDPFGGLLCLDFGEEFGRPTVPIAGELWERLQVTVPLASTSMLLIYLLALPLGIYSARRSGTPMDTGLTLLLFFLYSIPAFWAGLMLILGFGVSGLDWLPVLGLHSKEASELEGMHYVWDVMLHSILPVATLTYAGLAYLSRQMRVGMIDVLQADYIRTARAKGLSERVVLLKHALRNSLIPVVTLLASILPLLIGGSLIVEVIFNLPGMGRYAFEGLMGRDYGIVMATTTLSALLTLIGILLSDVAYAMLDPRISYDD